MYKDKEETSSVVDDVDKENHVWCIKKGNYDIASLDGSGLIITTVQLKENNKDNNYFAWEKATRLTLRSKKKLGFINRMIPILENDTEK